MLTPGGGTARSRYVTSEPGTTSPVAGTDASGISSMRAE